MTDWFRPKIKPKRTGYFLVQFFEAGWMYDWMAYWDMDRKAWLDKKGGATLIDQNLTWRGATTEMQS